MTIRVAAAQISSGADKAANLAAATEAIAAAARAGAAVVVLPEATMVAFGNTLAEYAEPLDGPFATALRQAAADAGIVAIAGLFTPSDDGRVHNTLVITGPGVEAHYNKIHLYDAFGAMESETVAPGQDLVTFTVAGHTVGVATCYDLRFADQFRALGQAGAELICVAASWGDGPGKAEQWDLLTRARAADGQAFLVACDQAWVPPVGADPLGLGRSVVVDPLGRVRARLGHEADLLVTDVDLDVVAGIRARVPIL